MNNHNLFYYPYASFADQQLPLLKVAALYFDKLYLLDPVEASWGTIGTGGFARDAVMQLRDAGILEIITPATVLQTYEADIAEAIRRDMASPDFLSLCDNHVRAKGKPRWLLSLAKVPQDLQADQMMRQLMGDFARDVARRTSYDASDNERATEYGQYSETGRSFDEFCEGYTGSVEYRYADFPLALGEAIMMNHALFAGLMHSGATPITDDPFHSRALALKLRRVLEEPAIEQAVNERARTRQLKADQLAAIALMDEQLALPILSPDVPLAEILEYRSKHDADLQQAREKLARMARRIEAEPWSDAFAKELEHRTIPDLVEELEKVGKVRDSWLNGERGRQVLKAAGVVAGAATAILAIVTAPVTPVALVSAGLGLVAGTVIPGGEWLLDWSSGKKAAQENGLHYLLKA